MKKIPDHLNDPVDVVIYDACNAISPYFKETHHTPNIITAYSLITGFLAVYFLYKKNIVWFAVFMMISYFFDCFDGAFARKYKMMSKFGDYYDHVKDTTVFISIAIVLFIRYRSSISVWNLLFAVTYMSIMYVFFGCQQKYYKEKHPEKLAETLDSNQSVCKDTSQLAWLRFFGPGIACIVLTSLIVYIWYKDSKRGKK